ncbi:arsenic resistance protein [Cnuibacter sp. UC19_7]|uniref:arsenic resistance protein n=1 Tax=Cnuibacter sp. UC19_7 TaxID=3350166 RepID=UPI00366ED5FD
MIAAVSWWDRHQVAVPLAALGLGAVVGLLAPSAAPALSLTITPILGLLLFATFVGVPLLRLARSFLDVRFLVTVLILDFVVAPLAAFALSRGVVDDRGLLLGVLLVLLTPCVDYVVVFTGLAGGDRARLLACTPLVMLLQIVLLPGYLALFAGADATADLDLAPFIEAFLLLIALPLAAAAVVQALTSRMRSAAVVERASTGAMVPLMALTLAVVVASQIAAVGTAVGTLVRLIPLYIVFLGAMVAVGLVVARIARLDTPSARAVTFSGATRNSLVVLPLALALPPSLGIAALAVVTQTLVELVGMVLLVGLFRRRDRLDD